MKKLKVVAHEYEEERKGWDVRFNEKYFPIGSVHRVIDGTVISSIDLSTTQRLPKPLRAESTFSAIVFTPVSEPDQ